MLISNDNFKRNNKESTFTKINIKKMSMVVWLKIKKYNQTES